MKVTWRWLASPRPISTSTVPTRLLYPGATLPRLGARVTVLHWPLGVLGSGSFCVVEQQFEDVANTRATPLQCWRPEIVVDPGPPPASFGVGRSVQ